MHSAGRAAEDGTDLGEDESAQVLDRLREIVQGLRHSSHAAERLLGVSGAQLFVLNELAAHPGLSVRELSERTLTDPSSASVVVSRLVEAGLVTRRRADEDARRNVLDVTRAGRKLLSRAPEPYQKRLIAAIRAMPGRQRHQLARSLEVLVEALGPAASTSLFFENAAPEAPATTKPTRPQAAPGDAGGAAPTAPKRRGPTSTSRRK